MQKVLLQDWFFSKMSDVRQEKNKKNVSMIIDPHKQMTKCKSKKEFLKKNEEEEEHDRTTMDESEKISS